MLEKLRADDRKWLVENARRIDGIAAQAREQTNQAMEFARTKCADVDSRILGVDACIRAELSAGVPGLMKDFDHKMAAELPGLVRTVEARAAESLAGAMSALEAKMVGAIGDKLAENKFNERIEALDQALKAQQAYLQSAHDAKPGDAQNLLGSFKYLDEELGKVNAAMADPTHKHTIIAETIKIARGMADEIKKEYDGKLFQFASTTSLPNLTAQVPEASTPAYERLKSIENDIAVLKLAVAA